MAAFTTTTTSSFSSSPSSSAAPSHIFIVRHGARLDAADKDWSLTSPTPYDTPLTYGGWIQMRYLGTRIASLLRDAAAVKLPGNNKKRMQIVIHSSPFLRCMQTSVSIASGMAQHHHQQTVDTYWERGVTAEPFVKPVLRLDAWLGEWLLPDYYTDIAPPPPSRLMVRTACDEYLRASFGMGTPTGSFAKPPPHHPHQQQHDEATLSTSLTDGFDPPPPNYAASNSGPIPKGYVSQAKELVDLDFAWDSARLGEGAELGEGWSSMMMRFHNGYERLLRWYGASKSSVATASTASLAVRSTTTTTTTIPTTNTPTPPLSEPDSEDDCQDIETVVILVTHGCGCNALLGAITDKPVLIDVGIGSVSWGVLRPSSRLLPSSPSLSTSSPSSSSSSSSSPSSKVLPIYDLRLTANTEHMRPLTPSGETPPRSPCLSARPPRSPSGLGCDFVLSSSGVEGVGAGSSARFLGRFRTTRSASQDHNDSDSVRPTGGLWTMPRPQDGQPARERSKTWVKFDDAVAVAADATAALAAKERGDDKDNDRKKDKDKDRDKDRDKGQDKDKDEGGLAVSAADPVGLWTAKAWKSPPKRR